MRRASMEGDMPSPINPTPGCRFYTRCSVCKADVQEQTPAMKDVARGHMVACHLY